MAVGIIRQTLELCSAPFGLGSLQLGFCRLKLELEDLCLAVARTRWGGALGGFSDEAGHDETQALIDGGELFLCLALRSAVGRDLLGPTA